MFSLFKKSIGTDKALEVFEEVSSLLNIDIAYKKISLANGDYYDDYDESIRYLFERVYWNQLNSDQKMKAMLEMYDLYQQAKFQACKNFSMEFLRCQINVYVQDFISYSLDRVAKMKSCEEAKIAAFFINCQAMFMVDVVKMFYFTQTPDKAPELFENKILRLEKHHPYSLSAFSTILGKYLSCSSL